MGEIYFAVNIPVYVESAVSTVLVYKELTTKFNSTKYRKSHTLTLGPQQFTLTYLAAWWAGRVNSYALWSGS